MLHVSIQMAFNKTEWQQKIVILQSLLEEEEHKLLIEVIFLGRTECLNEKEQIVS